MSDLKDRISAYNNGVKPLVMAYIGQDDPHRGDSKGAIGVGRIVAQMIGGDYVYVDEQRLAAKFNEVSGYSNQLQCYIQSVGDPDIVIGPSTSFIRKFVSEPTTLSEERYNEDYSQLRVKDSCGVVSHDLTDGFLNAAGRCFSDHNVERNINIQGPLIGVLMGGAYGQMDMVAKSMVDMTHHMPEATFYLCPSRRTGMFHFKALKREIEIAAMREKTEIHIIGESYARQAHGYNPYHGLLAKADHLVIAGDSGSIISEALYTKKRIYVASPPAVLQPLIDKGHITDLFSVSGQPFLNLAMPRVNVTTEVAASIAYEYMIARDEKIKRKAYLQGLVKCL
jgi:hypothetical protein